MPKADPALDGIDHELLNLLQRDSGRTLRELGDLVALSPSAVQRRIEVADRLLKQAPNVRRYTTLFVLDPVRTGTAVPTRALAGP